MIETLREQQTRIESEIAQLKKNCDARLEQLFGKVIEYYKLLDQALTENASLKARISEIEQQTTTCPWCKGTGKTEVAIWNGKETVMQPVDCVSCIGTGRCEQ